MKSGNMLSIIMIALMAGSGSAFGSLVAVDFGADYSSGYINATDATATSAVDADFDGNSDDRMRGITLGTTYSPMNSASFTNRTGKSGTGMKYGVSLATLDSSTDPTIANNRFTPTDDTYVGTTDTVGANERLATAWYWEKSSFLNGANAASGLSFANAAGSLTAVVKLAGSNVGASMRGASFLVQNDGQWYINAFTSAGTPATLSINAATANWYVFDPAAGTLFFDRSAYGTAVQGSSFANITALGIYEQQEVFSTTAAQGINSFQAMLVPEPATIGMLGLGAVAILFARRMRK
jgi:hypothetical protein